MPEIRGDIKVIDGDLMLRVPRAQFGDGRIDVVDRVARGAAFLRALIGEGLWPLDEPFRGDSVRS